MRISDWSSDVCSSDLLGQKEAVELVGGQMPGHRRVAAEHVAKMSAFFHRAAASGFDHMVRFVAADPRAERHGHRRSEARRGGKECVSMGRSRWSPAN